MLAAIMIALFVSSFSSGGDVAGTLMARYVEEPLKTSVADDTRRARALKAHREIRRDIDALNEAVRKDADQFEKLVRDYDSTAGDFDRLFTAAHVRREQSIDRIWDHRRALLGEVTREEWQQIIARAKVAQMKARSGHE